MARPSFTQLTLHDGVVRMDARLDPEIAYSPWELTQCMPPQSKPDDPTPENPDAGMIWVKRSGNVEMSILADRDSKRGIFYGRRGRLILWRLMGEAILTGSPLVNLGPSMAGFLRTLGLASTGGPRGTRAVIGDQVVRLCNSSFKVRWIGDTPSAQRELYGEHAHAMRFATYWDVWWSTSDDRPLPDKLPTHPKRDSVIRLSDDFYNWLRRSPVPYYFEAGRLLSHSALAMDLYIYFVGRLPKIDPNKPFFLKDIELVNLFSSTPLPDDATKRAQLIYDVRRDIGTQLEAVLEVYHDANVKLVKGGMLMHNSPKHVPPKGEHAKTRARRAATVSSRRVHAAAIDANRGRRPARARTTTPST